MCGNVQKLSSEPFKKNVPLASHTSWLVGGPAQFFAEPSSIGQVSSILKFAQAENVNVTVLGGGTNVLVPDEGIQGIVISLAKLTGIEILEQDKVLRLSVLAGTPKSELLKIFLKHKLGAAAMMGGLPGQVGGGVVMNAGVSEKLVPREFCEITSWIEVCRPNGTVERLDSQNLHWAYRTCEGWKPGVIVRVGIECPLVADPGIVSEVKKLNQLRLSKQPLEFPSCGSVFRNPLPQHAGKLIETAGLKGFKIGGAQVSEKHANFIINVGSAKASDIKSVVDHCINTVQKKFQVSLHPEFINLGK